MTAALAQQTRDLNSHLLKAFTPLQILQLISPFYHIKKIIFFICNPSKIYIEQILGNIYIIYKTHRCRMKRYSMSVSGKVQGVFYRDFARKEAEKLNLKGYVKNLDDGKVEIIAEGNEADLRSYVIACRKGPLMAFVKSINVEESKATGEFEDFNIRYSD